MEVLLSIRFFVAALYLIAAIQDIILLRSGRRRAALPSIILGSALLVHLSEIVIRGAESGAAGGAPFASMSGFLSIFAFLLGMTYMFLEQYYRQFRISSLGAFHVPIIFVLHLGSVVLKQPILDVPRLNKGFLFVCHVIPTIFSYSALTAGFVSGIAFLLLDSQLRNKRFDGFLMGLPNLDLLERVNATAVRIGLLLVATGGIVGILMGYKEWGWAYVWDEKVWMTLAIAVIFGAQLVMRRFAGWTGRRAIIVSMIGFLAIVLNATVINYTTQLHKFR